MTMSVDLIATRMAIIGRYSYNMTYPLTLSRQCCHDTPYQCSTTVIWRTRFTHHIFPPPLVPPYTVIFHKSPPLFSPPPLLPFVQQVSFVNPFSPHLSSSPSPLLTTGIFRKSDTDGGGTLSSEEFQYNLLDFDARFGSLVRKLRWGDNAT